MSKRNKKPKKSIAPFSDDFFRNVKIPVTSHVTVDLNKQVPKNATFITIDLKFNGMVNRVQLRKNY